MNKLQSLVRREDLLLKNEGRGVCALFFPQPFGKHLSSVVLIKMTQGYGIFSLPRYLLPLVGMILLSRKQSDLCLYFFLYFSDPYFLIGYKWKVVSKFLNFCLRSGQKLLLIEMDIKLQITYRNGNKMTVGTCTVYYTTDVFFMEANDYAFHLVVSDDRRPSTRET